MKVNESGRAGLVLGSIAIASNPRHAHRGCSSRTKSDARGQGLLEYSIALGLIAVLVLAILQLVGHNSNNGFCAVSNGLSTGGGAVVAWGDDGNGAIGNGSLGGTVNSPYQVNICSATQLGSGVNFSSALKLDGTVWSWGRNTHGQLGNGDGSLASRLGPVQVVAGGCGSCVGGYLTGVTQIAAGVNWAMALRNDGTVWSWGYEGYGGQLGDNTTANANQLTPQQVWGGSCGAPQGCTGNTCGGSTCLTGVTQIAAYGSNGEALRSDGSVWTWGDNSLGQLGNGAASCGAQPCVGSATPVAVTGLGAGSGITNIAAGANDAYAYVANTSTLYSWGYNAGGEAGRCSFTMGCGGGCDYCAPGLVAGITGNITQVAEGGMGVAIASGGVWIWGENLYGELGNGCTIGTNCNNSYTPTQVAGLSGITSVGAAAYTVEAVTTNGPTWTWGDNRSGQLGQGACCTSSSTPTKLSSLSALTTGTGGASGGESFVLYALTLKPIS